MSLGQKLKQFGKMSIDIVARVFPPMVHREDIADMIGYVENAGVPSAVTPDFVGQWLFDTSNKTWYRANSVTSGDWTQMGVPGTSGSNFGTQAAPAAKTTATTLTAEEILAGLLTGNCGGAAGANYTLPLGTSIETAWLAINPGLANDDAFDFTLVNISTNAAEDLTIVTNTGLTLVGSVVVSANATLGEGGSSAGTFRVRRTAANTFSVYRIS